MRIATRIDHITKTSLIAHKCKEISKVHKAIVIFMIGLWVVLVILPHLTYSLIYSHSLSHSHTHTHACTDTQVSVI